MLGNRLRQATATAAVALGGAPLGNLFRPVTDVAAQALLDRAWQRGIRYFDTAPHYGNGLSERRFGAALRARPRGEYLLSTKVGRLLHAAPDAAATQHGYVDLPPYVQSYDYSRAGVLRSLAASRVRLGIERIDIVYVHDLDRATHGAAFERHYRDLLDSGLPALAELKRRGDIAGYGIGVNGVAICHDVLQHADLDVILLAGRYTLADTSAAATLLPACRRRGVALVLGGPYNSGILATGAHPRAGDVAYFDYAPAPAAIVARVAAIEAVCARHHVPLRAAALQFVAAHPAAATVLAGARSEEEVDDLVTMRRFPIPAAFWHELQGRGLVAADAPLPPAAP
ncbi:MAG: aldo/keto reductase [Burkholderiales bacterium]|nr:aldo/keto reductase [Burkholderiales bacterium]